MVNIRHCITIFYSLHEGAQVVIVKMTACSFFYLHNMHTISYFRAKTLPGVAQIKHLHTIKTQNRQHF